MRAQRASTGHGAAVGERSTCSGILDAMHTRLERGPGCALTNRLDGRPRQAANRAAPWLGGKNPASQGGRMPRLPIDQHLARIPLFSELSKSELRQLSRLSTAVDVEPGRVLVREGEPGAELLVIVEGEARVEREGKTLATRGPGEFFGEIALLLDRPRTASAIAQTAMMIEVIERRAFKDFLHDNPKLYEPLLKATVSRLADLQGDG